MLIIRIKILPIELLDFQLGIGIGINTTAEVETNRVFQGTIKVFFFQLRIQPTELLENKSLKLDTQNLIQ